MVGCPLCGSPAVKVFPTCYGREPYIAGQRIRLGHQSWVLNCEACDFKFTNPVPDAGIIRAAYKSAGTNVWREDPQNSIRRDYGYRVEALIRSAPEKSILDVGCYTGAFLNEFPDDWGKFGIEMSDAAADVATARGVNVLGSDFFHTPVPSEGFGAIAAMNIIEHVPDPVAFIKRALGFLRTGGVLLIETGDWRSPFARVMGDCWFYYHTPEHMSFFSHRGLVKLLSVDSVEILESRSKLFHKRPVGMRSWASHLRWLLRALKFRLFRRRSENRDEVPWVSHRDHVLVIVRKP
jgi:SAM-dependent methyltransferase